MVNVSVDQLAEAVAQAVRDYSDAVSDAVAHKVDEVADAILMDAAENAPVKTGAYARAFRKTSLDEFGRTRRIIWNKKFYRLVHLLEFGHAKRGGGRVPGRPHLRPAYERYGAQLPEHIKRIIERGGGA